MYNKDFNYRRNRRFNRARCLAWFATYLRDDQTTISDNGGIEQLCLELGYQLHDPIMMAIAYEMRASQMGIFTCEEWLRGFAELECDELNKMSVALDKIQKMLSKPEYYCKVFEFTYDYAKSHGNTELSIEIAIDMLQSLLGQRWLLSSKFIEFLKQAPYQVLTKIQWSSIFQFYRRIHYELLNYENDGTWPDILNEFVLWLQNQPITYSTASIPDEQNVSSGNKRDTTQPNTSNKAISSTIVNIQRKKNGMPNSKTSDIAISSAPTDSQSKKEGMPNKDFSYRRNRRFNRKRCLDWFATYLRDDQSTISDNGGIEQLCSEFGYQLRDPIMMAIAYEMGASRIGVITGEEWLKGLSELECDDLKKKSILLDKINKMLTNPEYYYKVFEFAYDYSKPHGNTEMSIEIAIEMLQSLLGQRWLLCSKFIEFLKQATYRVLTKIQWKSIFQFYRRVNYELLNYDNDGTWPDILNEFVLWLRADRHANNDIQDRVSNDATLTTTSNTAIRSTSVELQSNEPKPSSLIEHTSVEIVYSSSNTDANDPSVNVPIDDNELRTQNVESSNSGTFNVSNAVPIHSQPIGNRPVISDGTGAFVRYFNVSRRISISDGSGAFSVYGRPSTSSVIVSSRVDELHTASRSTTRDDTTAMVSSSPLVMPALPSATDQADVNDSTTCDNIADISSTKRKR